VKAPLTSEPLLVDVREPYRIDHVDASAASIPLGVILQDPSVVPRDRALLVRAIDGAQTVFAVRFLRERGHDARPAHR